MLNTPKNIFRSDKRISRTLTVELKKEGVKETRDRLMALQRQFSLPEGVSFSETRVRTRQEEIASMIFAAELSVIFIYLLMGFLFESFILPLSIICTIPLAGIGVAWIHYATGKDMDFLGFVGGILLIGVVVNNGIVLIDYVIRLRAEGMERTQALLMAAERRFRPIAMTALTTIIGMIPLTFSSPSRLGSELQKLRPDFDRWDDYGNDFDPAGGADLLYLLRRCAGQPGSGAEAGLPAAARKYRHRCDRLACVAQVILPALCTGWVG